jgi:hypothetical protein
MTALQFPQLPASFYDSTPYLRHIRQAAHYYRVAPDAVLVATLCRIAAATPPTTYIDTPEPTPLNLIGALIAAPGNGKSLGELQPHFDLCPTWVLALTIHYRLAPAKV